MANKPLSVKTVMQSVLDRTNPQKTVDAEKERIWREQAEHKAHFHESSVLIENEINRNRLASRKTVRVHNMKAALLSEALHHIFDGAINEGLKEDPSTDSIMRGMISTYIDEQGTDVILRRMHGATAFLSEMATTVDKYFKKVIEGATIGDPNDPPKDETVKITPEMKDDFFKAINDLDSNGIEQAIKDRVAISVGDFIQKNAEDKADIEEIMIKTKDKIDSIPDGKENLKESFSQIGKNAINKIRTAKQNVFGAMVTNMAESVMREPELQGEFMESTGHLDIEKIVDRTAIMYTFAEMVNTTRLETVDENYIKELLESLKYTK